VQIGPEKRGFSESGIFRPAPPNATFREDISGLESYLELLSRPPAASSSRLEQFTRFPTEVSPSNPLTALDTGLPINVSGGTWLALFNVLASYKDARLEMNKTKQRAISMLLLLGGILAVMATWNLPENLPPEVK
jgi:hypothetical protein